MFEALALTAFWFGVALLLLNYRNYPGRSRPEKTVAVLASVVMFGFALTSLMTAISRIPPPVNSVNVPLWQIQFIMAFVLLCVIALHWFTARLGLPPEMERMALFGTLITFAAISFIDYRGGVRWLATGASFWILVFFIVSFIVFAISFVFLRWTTGTTVTGTLTVGGRVVNYTAKILMCLCLIIMSWTVYSYIFVKTPL